MGSLRRGCGAGDSLQVSCAVLGSGDAAVESPTRLWGAGLRRWEAAVEAVKGV